MNSTPPVSASQPIPLLWVDLEMSGLDERKDVILEVAALVSDYRMNILGTFHEVVYQPPHILENMDDWCRKTHKNSGLTDRVPHGKQLGEVEALLNDFCDQFYKSKDRILLVGNSIGNDRRFIDIYMRTLASRLHYRIVDISSFKEIFRGRYGVEYKKKNSHRALDDIQESMAELKHYMSYVSLPENFPQNDNSST